MAVNISTLNINAPIQKVWDVLTQPELVRQWQYGSELITNWKPGSPIRFRAEWEGNVFEQWGTVLEVVPNQLIRYNLFAPRPDLEDVPVNYFVMVYLLTPENDGSVTLEIQQEDNRPGAKQVPPQGEENPALAALKALAEK